MNKMTRFLSEKDFNLAIYEEIKKTADEIFNNLVCAPGSYTAADIAKEVKGGPVVSFINGRHVHERTDEYYFNYDEKKCFAWRPGFDAAAVYTVEVESFSCQFNAWRVFEILKKAAAAWNVPTAKKGLFVRETESAPAVAGFDVPAAAIVKQLKNSCANDKLRPVMEGVYFDAARRVLVASDGHVMTVTAAPAAEVAAEFFSKDNNGVIISPALLKKGRITVDSLNMVKHGDGTAARAIEGHFPAWRNIVPSYRESQAVNLGGAWQQIKKAAASLAKFTDLQNNPVVLFGESYTNNLVLITSKDDGQEKRETVKLDETINFTFAIGVNGAQLAKIEKAEKMYLTDTSRPISFVAPGLYTLLMPVLVNDRYLSAFENLPYFETSKNATGAAVNVLSGIETEPVKETADDTPARPVRVRGFKNIEYIKYQRQIIKDYYFAKDEGNKYWIYIVPVFLRYLENMQNYLLLDISLSMKPETRNAANVPAAVYMEDTTKEERNRRYSENYDRRQELKKAADDRAAELAKFGGIDETAAAEYINKVDDETRANDETRVAIAAAEVAATVPGLDTTATAHGVKFDFAPYLEKEYQYNNTFAELVKNLNNPDIAETAKNEITGRALAAAHDFTARLGLVRHAATANELTKIFIDRVLIFADSQKEDTANDDTAAPSEAAPVAEVADIETPAAVPSEATETAADVPTVAAPAADMEKEDTAAPVEISTPANDDTAAPAAEVVNIEKPETSETAPAAVVFFVDVCETPANDDTAAPGFAAAPVAVSLSPHFWHRADDDTAAPAADIERETPANDDTRAAVAYLIRRARRLAVAVAATVAALLLTFASERETPATAAPLEFSTPAPAADIETGTSETPAAPSEATETAADVPTVAVPIMTPPTMEKRATAKKRQPRARRHRETARAAVLVPVDTTANNTTARALAVDTLESLRNITAPTDTAAARVDTLEAAGEITAAPADIEASTTANDDSPRAAVVITSDDDSETPAAPVDDDTANDDGTTAPTSTGTTAPPSPSTPAPAAVAVPAVPGVPAAVVLALLLTL